MKRVIRENGFTLIELLAVLAIIGMTVIAIGTGSRSGGQVWKAGDRYAEVMQNALIGMEKMTLELKQAKKLTAINSSSVAFNDWNNVSRSFQITARDGRQYLSTESGELSGPVQNLVFTYYRGDGATQVTEPYEVRLIDIRITTSDSKGIVGNIPLSSRICLGGDSIYPITKFVAFGGGSMDLLNGVVISGDIGGNGDILLRNNSSVRDIVNAGTVTYQNESKTSHRARYRAYTSFPPETPFPTGRAIVPIVISSNYLSPNSSGERYGGLSLGNNKTLKLSSGDYYFSSIDIGNSLSLQIDLTAGSGNIRIFVDGDVSIGRKLDMSVTGGGAANIYAESHGDWGMGMNCKWFGTIFTPNGGIDIVDGVIKGGLYSLGSVTIHNSSTLELIPCVILPPQFSL